MMNNMAAKKTTDTGTESRKEKQTTKLYRSEKDRIVGGVCAGLGEFFQIDSSVIRLIFVLITIFGGGGLLLYLILWLIVPSKGSASEITKENINKNADEMKAKAKEFAEDFKINTKGMNSRQLFGVVILVFGILLLLGNLNIFNFNFLWKFFPAAIIIILGIVILKRRD